MKTKDELERERRKLEAKLNKIVSKIKEFDKPNPIGFSYKGKK